MPVTVIVEDGTGVAGANSYQSVLTWKAYADQRGWNYSAYTDDQIGAALIRGAAWLDATYRGRVPGVRTHGTDQLMLWPRKAGSIIHGVYVADGYLTTVVDAEGVPISTTSIPREWVAAHAEATWRELQKPGSLAPDRARGGAIESVQAGPVAIRWSGNAPATTTFQTIDNMLAGLLVASVSPYSGRAVRA